MLETCDFDVLQQNECTLGKLCFMIFASTRVIELFNIPENVLLDFINAVKAKYRNNPFHNFYHAVHVLQNNYYVFRNTSIRKYLRNNDVLGMLVSSMCHDICHPGHNSDFEIKTGSELSIFYNDVSVLENMHAHETFKLLRQEEFNIFANIDVADRKELRKIIINAILATDMTHHKTFTASLGEKRSADKAFD